MSKESERKTIKASLTTFDILDLLDNDERAGLIVQLGITEPISDDSPSGYTNGRVIGEILRLRLPFIKMMRDVVAFLGHLEASIRGNVRFVVLPDSKLTLNLDFGPQVREAVATSLNSKFLADHSQIISERAFELELQVRSLCDRIRPGPVERYDSTGRMLHELSSKVPPGLGMRYQLMADNAFRHTLLEYHPGDKEALRRVVSRMDQLERLVRRLSIGSNGVNELAPELTATVNHIAGVLKGKLSAGPVSQFYPHPRRSIDEHEPLSAIKRIEALEEAVLSASDYAESLGGLFDFLNLEIWRQRWRLYELWVLSRVTMTLIDLGADLADTGRIVDGLWRLKFTKDADAILTLRLDGQLIDLYYQYYQARGDSGDMPDIAVRLRDGRFIAVIDPKHGTSYSRKDLNDVCRRYAGAFDPYLSCVVNYFDVRETEDLDQSPRSLVIYGLCPDSEPNHVFAEELIDALDRAWLALGLPSIRPSSVVVLFDGSSSTENCRSVLVNEFREALSALQPHPRAQSCVLVFGDTIVREGSLTDLGNESLLGALPGGGTNFSGAVRAALQRLRELPQPQHLWIFTDGEALGDVLSLADDVREAEVSTLIVESVTGRSDSVLRELSSLVGGRYRSLTT